jgi:predicted  nucleic acid-binding Zn-ribbon protein
MLQQTQFKLDSTTTEKDGLLDRLKKFGKDAERNVQDVSDLIRICSDWPQIDALTIEVKNLNEGKRKAEQLVEGLQQKETKYLERIQELSAESSRLSQQVAKIDGDLRSIKQAKLDTEAQHAEEIRKVRAELDSMVTFSDLQTLL